MLKIYLSREFPLFPVPTKDERIGEKNPLFSVFEDRREGQAALTYPYLWGVGCCILEKSYPFLSSNSIGMVGIIEQNFSHYCLGFDYRLTRHQNLLVSNCHYYLQISSLFKFSYFVSLFCFYVMVVALVCNKKFDCFHSIFSSEMRCFADGKQLQAPQQDQLGRSLVALE